MWDQFWKYWKYMELTKDDTWRFYIVFPTVAKHQDYCQMGNIKVNLSGLHWNSGFDPVHHSP